MNFALGYLIGYGYIFAVILCSCFAYKFFKIPNEVSRKIIHILTCFTYVIIYTYFKGTFHSIVMPASFIVINALSLKFHFFKGMERENGDKSKGTVYYAIAITILMICSLIWEQTLIPSGIAIFCLSFGDGFAALFGQFFGEKSVKITKNKTFVGSLACFVFSIIGIYILSIFVPVPLKFYEIAIISLSCAVLELAGHGLDNFTITIGTMIISTLFLSL